MNTQTTASLLANVRRTHGRNLRRKSVVALVFDGAQCHRMTEDLLDTWWANLTAEQKADIYELDLGPDDDCASRIAARVAEVEQAFAEIRNSPLRIVEATA